MRRTLQIFVALAFLAFIIAPFGSSAVWADHHEKKSPSKASTSKKAKSATASKARACHQLGVAACEHNRSCLQTSGFFCSD